MELAGAVLSARLRSFIQSEMRYDFKEVYHLVDSEIVKAMVNKSSYGFNIFAANRIDEIRETTHPEEWLGTAGVNNIADWITRGKSPKEISRESEWQQGLEYLTKPIEEWPISKEMTITELPETKKLVCNATAEPVETLISRMDIDRFCKFTRLINTTARIMKLYRRYKRNDEKPAYELPPDYISPKYFEQAERAWVVEAQRGLKNHVNARRYQRLCPSSKDGVIVVGGRGKRWIEVTWNHEEFILLPYDHRLTLLIAERTHDQLRTLRRLRYCGNYTIEILDT